MKMTLEKILQSQGFGSRKFCQRLVLDCRVEIGGIICSDPGQLAETDNLFFCVDGEKWEFREKLYLILNKPAGYECSHRPQHHPSVFSLFPQPFIQRGGRCGIGKTYVGGVIAYAFHRRSHSRRFNFMLALERNFLL